MLYILSYETISITRVLDVVCRVPGKIKYIKIYVVGEGKLPLFVFVYYGIRQ
jgi:hypothetical protein